MTKAKHSNRLAHETSPYLKQHAHNPVDWFPWGEEALKRSRREEKPIFLSIGYSACHWCHVMERESFENEETAKIMNEHFVNIKVDREERQDLDQIYMSAVQVMTQHGGWPMSVFLTPELEPFYGGTYFPDEDRMGMPSFKKILVGVANAWRTKREEVRRSAKQLVGALEEIHQAGYPGEGPGKVTVKLVEDAVKALARSFDPKGGGLGQAPKFFHSMAFKLCLRHWKRTGDKTALGMVEVTLDRWMRGGIHDQLGGGFHRYSTDAEWLAPHFEKMLYDNALLADLFLEAFQATRNEAYAETARQTLDYTLREMTSPDGGFYATQDADSEGVEGKFYVWTKNEIAKLLDPELAEQFSYVYDVTDGGNWEGHTILRRVHSLEEAAQHFKIEKSWLEESLAVARRKLFTTRATRIAPFRDEKLVTAWNGLMIEAMARGHQILGNEHYLKAAQDAAHFILSQMTTNESSRGRRLLHVHKDGKSRLNGYLDDYSNLVCGLLTLFESDSDPQWVGAARELAGVILDQFWDNVSHGFFYTGTDHEKLITRVKDAHDGAQPSGVSQAILGLLKLGKLTGEQSYLKKAEQALFSLEPMLRNSPQAATQSLVAVDFLLDKPMEIVVAAGVSPEETDAAVQEIRSRFLPNKVVTILPHGADRFALEKWMPLLRDRKPIGEAAAIYLCENATCKLPIQGLEALRKALG